MENYISNLTSKAKQNTVAGLTSIKSRELNRNFLKRQLEMEATNGKNQTLSPFRHHKPIETEQKGLEISPVPASWKDQNQDPEKAPYSPSKD